MSLIHDYGENKYQNGKNDGMKEGREEGMKEGREEGREELREEIICNLLESGETPQSIAQKTKIPLKEIEKIKEKYGL